MRTASQIQCSVIVGHSPDAMKLSARGTARKIVSTMSTVSNTRKPEAERRNFHGLTGPGSVAGKKLRPRLLAKPE